MRVTIPAEWPSPVPDDWSGEPRLVVFFVPLRDPISLPHGLTFALKGERRVPWLEGVAQHPRQDLPAWPIDVTGDSSFVSIRVWRPTEQFSFDARPLVRALRVARGLIPNDWLRDDSTTTGLTFEPSVGEEEWGSTVIECVAPLLPEVRNGRIDIDLSVAMVFDECVTAIQELVRAYVLASGDLNVPPLQRQGLYPLVPWGTRDPHSATPLEGLGLWATGGFTPLHGSQRAELSAAVVGRVVHVVRDFKVGNPYALAFQLRLAAERAFNVEGDGQTAVIRAETSIELLLDTTLFMSAFEHGDQPTTVRDWRRRTFSWRIKERMSSYFDGRWDHTAKRTIIGRWAVRVRNLRNRVAHSGYHPTEREVASALAAASDVWAFTEKRITKGRARIPRTALTFLGGVPDHDAQRSRSAVARAYAADPEGEAWREAFGDWFEKTDPWR